MNKFSLNELLNLSKNKIIINDFYFYEFFFDSRNIIEGENGVFFCFEKNPEKAKKYILQAFQRKVRIFVSPFKLNLENSIFIETQNPIKLLQDFAKNHLKKFPNLITIGITGSNGKTIIKEWIFKSLKNNYSIIRSPKSYNSQIGLALSILETTQKNDLGIFECGISKPLEMTNLEIILKPKIGILTNIGTAHNENFKSEEELINEKLILFKDSDVIIYNNDNKYVRKIIKQIYPEKKIISFGENKNSDLRFISCKNKILKINYSNKVFNFKVNFDDKASISNQLCLILTLFYFNFSHSKIQEKLTILEPIEMRLEIKNGIYDSIILNDTFNADYSSIKIALETLQNQNKSKKIVVITDIFEVEKEEKKLYENIFNLLNKYILDKIICVGNLITKYNNFSKNPIISFSSTQDLINNFNYKEIENSVILIKGSRKFKLENFVKTIEIKSHDTILEINLNSIIENIQIHKQKLNSSTKIMAMVKANSYGTGNFEIAEFLQYHKIDYLGVAYADEGAILRKQGIYLPIMVMNPEQNSYSTIIDYTLEPEIYSLRVLKLFLNKLNKKTLVNSYPIHIKLDTGMHRLGFLKNQISELCQEIQKNQNIYVKSIFTHLASTDENDRNFTDLQILRFNEMYEIICNKLNYKPIKHALNSHGTIYFPEYQFDMVRIGIGMYGFSSDEKIQKKLKNVVTLKTKISQIIEIQKGESVGYNRKFIAEKNTKIATLPIGYADGISRNLGNGKFNVLINNQKAKTIGSICMDMLMINLENINCNEGDEVIIYGENNSIKKIAESIQTISYELLTSISSRVKRIYYKD